MRFPSLRLQRTCHRRCKIRIHQWHSWPGSATWNANFNWFPCFKRHPGATHVWNGGNNFIRFCLTIVVSVFSSCLFYCCWLNLYIINLLICALEIGLCFFVYHRIFFHLKNMYIFNSEYINNIMSGLPVNKDASLQHCLRMWWHFFSS